MIEMAIGSEKIMGLCKQGFGGNLFSKEKTDHELYIYTEGRSRRIK